MIEHCRVYKVVKVWAKGGRYGHYFSPFDPERFSREYHLISAFASGAARVLYPLGERVQAPDYLKVHGYNLTAFDTYARAVWFVRTHGVSDYSVVFEADAWNVRTRGFPAILGQDAISVPDKYDLSVMSLRKGRRGHWPHGTVLCETLALDPEGCCWSNLEWAPLRLFRTGYG